MSEEVKLYGMWASPFSRRVEIALKIKGVPYEYIEEDLYNKSPELLKYNPVHKKVPVLVHNGEPLAESLVILEYIDETWKNNPIMPADPYERAQARFWAKFADEKILITAYRKAFLCDNKEREKGIEETQEQLEFLENELKGKNFLGGESIGYADVVAFGAVHWVVVMQDIMEREVISKEKFPAVNKWIKKLVDIDVVKESIPPKEKHVAYMKARREFRLSASKLKLLSDSVMFGMT